MSGFQNENDIIEALDNKKFIDLNANLKKMVLKINDNNNMSDIYKI